MPKKMLKIIIYIISVVLLLIAGKYMLQEDYFPFLQWWAVIAGLGIIFMPLTYLIFANFNDKGYLFSKTIGIAITGYLMWLLSSTHTLKFTELSCIICVIISLILNGIILILIRIKRNRQGGSLVMNKTEKEGNSNLLIIVFKNKALQHIIIEELVFFALFLLFTYIRGFKPEAYGTEKFMDYGFMTSMMRNEYIPPQDFWFSGTSINYYYVGQYMATFLTKLSSVKVSLGYNLMLMMIGALACVLPYSLVSNVATEFVNNCKKKSRFIPTISGVLAGVGVCIAGNMHYPIYNWIIPAVRKILGMAASKGYWFPDATRYIGYNPDTHDKTIHEFPCYSFVLGDLHAHVINIMFVVTVLGILFAWLCTRRKLKDTKIPLIKEILSPAIVLVSFFIGLFHTTNYWDFPIYFVVSGAIILFGNLIVYNFKGKAFGVTALQGIFVFAFSEFICLPFTLYFSKISTVPLFTVAQTPLYQLEILWGLPIITILVFLYSVISDFYKKRKLGLVVKDEKKELALFSFMKNLSSADLFILTIGLCAIGLILLPEIIYIEDIYSGDYKRANTMFKLTYQAFIMFGICMGYIFIRLIAFGKTIWQKCVAIIMLILFLLTVCYVQNAVKAWYGNIFNPKAYKGLDCTEFMDTIDNYKDDVAAIDWLNENVSGTPVVLEANGDSYSDYERVSVMTGFSTILGWHTHEWLWKSDVELVDSRAVDIEAIYTADDKIEIKRLLKEYKVSYIYVGKLEQDKFVNLNHEMLKSLGDVVYISPATEEKTYETYIVKMKE